MTVLKREAMSEQTETIFGVLGIIGVAGWSVLQWLQQTDKARHEDLKDAINQQFQLAELNRKVASEYWKSMFNEQRSNHSDIVEQLNRLEERVGVIEMELVKMDDRNSAA